MQAGLHRRGWGLAAARMPQLVAPYVEHLKHGICHDHESAYACYIVFLLGNTTGNIPRVLEIHWMPTTCQQAAWWLTQHKVMISE